MRSPLQLSPFCFFYKGRIVMSKAILGKQFMLTAPTPLIVGAGGVLKLGNAPELPSGPLGGIASCESPLSRRDFVKVTAVGAGTLLGWGASTNRAKAEPFTFLGIMITFVVGVFAGVVTNVIMDRIRNARWYRHSLSGDDAEERFHLALAPPYITNTVVEPIQSTRYRDCHFDLNRFGRFGAGRELDCFKDLNAPEYRRLHDELREDGPYRPVANPRESMRRRLTRRDLNLFRSTLQLYANNGRVPAASEITPAYARELCDSRGRRYTGFGLSLRSGEKNFLVANASSA